MWAPGKKSIFNIDNDYDEADMNAPEYDEGDYEQGPAAEKVKVPQTVFVG